ncbi:DNA polymerase III subunit beta [Edaphosphingomonas haloaromaticamans]|uniref:Beta sliding clamp n=1 Tax=Edaphosphingomonas haloaromaticamans TaxID=653954 RepID=A0A1S1HEI6_9SPHN|nr:DNA polymerase III subunit beta [Sphingomonas haloaromaticamans]OHT19941.1 DNA polymerase III subunit beta [Sphingomonas haloaromaticamans]
MSDFTFDRDVLLGAIRTIGDVVPTRNTIPILNNLLIDAREEGSAVLRGTDLDRQVSIEIGASGRGAFTAPKDKLAAAVKSLRPGELTVELVDGRAVMKQGRATRTLPTLPATDMATLKDPEGAIRFEVDRAQFQWLLDTSSIAMSTEVARVYLNGVYLHVTDTSLRSVSTDGARLVCADIEMPEDAILMPGLILPNGAVGLLRRLLAGSKETKVQVAASAQRIAVRIGDTQMIAKAVEGTYPDYRRIIPTQPSPRRLEVQASELARGIRDVAAITDGKSRAIHLNLGGDCVLSASGTFSSALEPIEARFSGHPLNICVNASYAASIAEMFGEADHLEVCFDPNDEAVGSAPILVRSPRRPSLVALVTPMRG